MNITILDTETTIHCERKGESGTPHDPNNKIVWLGEQRIKNGVQEEVQTHNLYTDPPDIVPDGMMVGANLKFDLGYLRKTVSDEDWMKWIAKGGQVWDIQLAEYLLTGQQSKMASLDGMSAKYGLPLKDSKMKEYWDKGISTEHIPENEIVPYLVQDVENTREIFFDQVQQAERLGMLPLIRTQMEALLATQEMEYNGMHIDKEKLTELILDKEAEVGNMQRSIYIYIYKVIDNDIHDTFNIGSNNHLAHLFFGTELKYKIDKPTGAVYKTGLRKGLPKTKKETVSIGHSNTTGVSVTTTPSGKVKIDATVLKNLASTANKDDALQLIASQILEYKKVEKELSTYLYPIRDRMWGHDGCIHHSLNQCITSTGRLSSSKPNLQNVPREGTADVKDVFTSKYGDAGSIIEIDYSQLEVIGLAHLSQDTQLMHDVSHGVDMHLKNASVLFNKNESKVTKEERRQAKVGTFQLQYGAGAKTISEQSSLTMAQAKRLIAAYYTRYPTIQDLHAKIEKSVLLSRKGTSKRTPKGYPAGEGMYLSETGRRYIFNEYDAPDWLAHKKDVGFSPTEMKNYPVQGFATADIVPMMLGKVLKNVMTKFPEVKMINTVHDSVLFDCPNKDKDRFIEQVSAELRKTRQYLDDVFSIDCVLEFPFDVEVGKSWGTVKKY